jgi:signal transduction histidine kinase
VEGNLNVFIGQLRDQYRRAGVNLRTVLDESPVYVRYKPVALTRLLYNLVDNGCRHGTGSIEITVCRDRTDVLLSVRNPVLGNPLGTGLTEALSGDAQQTKTSGLGLSIVRQFAQVHQAGLEESLEEGIKTFTLRFKGRDLT